MAGPVSSLPHKISIRFVHNFWSQVLLIQTNKKATNAEEATSARAKINLAELQTTYYFVY